MAAGEHIVHPAPAIIHLLQHFLSWSLFRLSLDPLSTKYWIDTIPTGVYKTLASTEVRRRQNIYINKMLAHAQIMYKSGGVSPYCFGVAKSALAGFSQTSLMFSSLKMLHPPHTVTKWLVEAGRPAFIGGLSPELNQVICTSLPCRNVTKYWCRQNIGARQDFTYFRQKFSSQYLCLQACYRKVVKVKSNHHHCAVSVFYSWSPSRGRHKDPLFLKRTVPNGVGVRVPYLPLVCR